MIKAISQHVEKYYMGHYNTEELVMALVADNHFDSNHEAAFFLESEYGSSQFRAAEIMWDLQLYYNQ
jgi:hypothetical protein